MPKSRTIGRRADAIDAFIGQRIRSARITAGMSQTALADLIGVTFQQVQKYEKGVNRVGGGRMVRIAEVLGRPIAWFSEGTSSDAAGKGKAPIDDPLTVLGQKRDGIALARAFNTIADPVMRRAILDMAEASAAAARPAQRRAA